MLTIDFKFLEAALNNIDPMPVRYACTKNVV